MWAGEMRLESKSNLSCPFRSGAGLDVSGSPVLPWKTMEAAELSDFLNLIFSCNVGIGLDLLISESSSLVVTGETSRLDTLEATNVESLLLVSAALTVSQFSQREKCDDKCCCCFWQFCDCTGWDCWGYGLSLLATDWRNRSLLDIRVELDGRHFGENVPELFCTSSSSCKEQ